MTGRERLSRVYRGQSTDRIPWAPLMDETTLSEYDQQTRAKGVVEFTRRIGADILGRCGVVKAHSTIKVDASSTPDETNALLVSREIRTTLGTIRTVKHGHSIIEPLLKTPTCFEVYQYLYGNQTFFLNIDNLLETERQVGNDGITAVPLSSTPVQALVQDLMGVEAFTYALHDYPSEMTALMECMHAKNKEMYQVAARSPAEIFILVENTSTTMISPEVYRQYSMGHVKDFVDIMHENGKIAVVHMCGLINDLLPLIKQTGLDGIDCLTPPPTGNADFRNAYRIIGGHLTIHGMLDPTEWLPASVTVDDIAANIGHLLTPDILGKPFVFCTASDGMPGVPLEKYDAIRKAIRACTV